MDLKSAHIITEKERTKDIEIEENVTFDEMYLSDAVLHGLHACGFVRPSPIQLSAIPLGRCGLDLIVQAKSGTGKTCVFSVIALEMICVSAKTTQALVIAPTREIAVQISQVINSIGSALPNLRASTFIGGTDVSEDKAKLQCCHIAIGTPGRLNQLASLGNLNLNNVRLLVLDEADQLLAQQFKSAILDLVNLLPLNKQVLAMSATYPREVTDFLDKFMRSPSHVRLGKESPSLIGVQQYVRLLPDHPQSHQRHKIKYKELLSILSCISFNQCLVFSNSQLRAESICNQLRSSGWPVAYLTGGQMQSERLQAFFALCSYKCRILVSTDLSARGIDSEHVNLVINLDIPTDPATYLHRVGRAGRFGSKGVALSLVCEGEEWEAIRAVSTITNVEIKLLKDDDDLSTIAEENESLETLQHLSESDCSKWFQKQNKKKTVSKPKTDNKAENQSSNDTKLHEKSNKKKTKGFNTKDSVELTDNIMNLRNGTDSHLQNSVEEKPLPTVPLKHVLCDYKKDYKPETFAHSELFHKVSENWEYLSKSDTPNLKEESLLKEYPSSSVFHSLDLYMKNRDQEATSNISITPKNSEISKNFDVQTALQNVITGSQSVDKISGGSSDHSISEMSNSFIESKDEETINAPQDLIQNLKNNKDEKDTVNEKIIENGNSSYNNLERNEVPSDSQVNNKKCLNAVDKSNGEVDVSHEVLNARHAKAENFAKNTGYGKWKTVSTEAEKNIYDDGAFENNNDSYSGEKSEYSEYCNPRENFDYLHNNAGSINSLHSNDEYYSYHASTLTYIKSAQKFGMMMEYVKTLGRMSHWMAMDQNRKMIKSHAENKKPKHKKKSKTHKE